MKTLAEDKFSKMLTEIVSEPGHLSTAYSAFYGYSLGNQLLALFECYERSIQAGPINTYKGWTALGRQVKKGERAITLCMPVTCKSEDKNDKGEPEQHVYTRFIFRPNWFTLAQTEGQDYKHDIKIADWNPELALTTLGIEQVPLENLNGNIQGYAKDKTIAISPIAEFTHKTRFHELAHVVHGHTREHTMTDSEHTPRDIREVEAESVAYILCSLLDLPGKTESRGYIQHWLNGQPIPEKSAMKIFSATNKILTAGQTKKDN